MIKAIRVGAASFLLDDLHGLLLRSLHGHRSRRAFVAAVWSSAAACSALPAEAPCAAGAANLASGCLGYRSQGGPARFHETSAS
jgi:hypothetical protein